MKNMEKDNGIKYHNMQEKRKPYLDYARVFVAYLVIYGHLLPMDNHIPRYYIYAFHMPFFFMVSGMLHKLNGTIQWKKYLRTIGIPLLFFNLFFFFIVNPFYFRYVYLDELVNGNYWIVLISGFPRLWDGIIGEGNLPSGVTWFLVALLWNKLMMDVIYCHKKIGWTIFVILFFVTIGFHVKLFLIRNGMMAFPFYYVGCKYKDLIEKMIFRKNAYLYALICFLLLIGMVELNGKVSVYDVSFGSKGLPTYLCVTLFYVTAIVGSVMMLFLSTYFKGNLKITYIATSLITILGIQAVFNDPYRDLLHETNYFIISILSCIILLLCVGIHWLIMRYIPFALGKTKDR